MSEWIEKVVTKSCVCLLIKWSGWSSQSQQWSALRARSSSVDTCSNDNLASDGFYYFIVFRGAGNRQDGSSLPDDSSFWCPCCPIPAASLCVGCIIGTSSAVCFVRFGWDKPEWRMSAVVSHFTIISCARSVRYVRTTSSNKNHTHARAKWVKPWCHRREPFWFTRPSHQFSHLNRVRT